MKKQLALLAIGTAIISAPALANEAKLEQKAQYYLDKMDTDNNDQVSKAEHDAFATNKFSEADSDGNGSLTLAELTTAKQKEKDELKSAIGDDDKDGEDKAQ